MRNGAKNGVNLLVLTLLLAFTSLSNGSQSQIRFQNHALSEAANQAQTKAGVVYVCACLKNRSCFCMTEAKMEGPCACGTQGGPPLKAVDSDSDWAKTNREALAK
jgi:hypothetical protein